MPEYLFECPFCKRGWSEHKPVARCSEKTACPTCGRVGARIYTASGAGPVWGDEIGPYGHDDLVTVLPDGNSIVRGGKQRWKDILKIRSDRKKHNFEDVS